MSLVHGVAIKELLKEFEFLKSDVNMVTSFSLISFFCVAEEQEYMNSLAVIDIATEEFAAIGWCFGGGQVLQLSLNSNDHPLSASILYY